MDMKYSVIIVSVTSAFGVPDISQTMSGCSRKRPLREVGANSTPYTCDQCPMGFSKPAGLNIHRGKVHKNGHQHKRHPNGSREVGQQNAAESTGVDDDVDQDQRSHEENCCPICKVFNVSKKIN